MKKGGRSRMRKIKELLNNKDQKMKKYDYIILGIILLCYSILSFVNLGSIENPQTFYTFSNKEYAIFEFDDLVDVVRLKMYNGESSGQYDVYVSADGEEYSFLQDINGNGCFSWNEEKILQRIQYIKIMAAEDNLSIGEITFYDNRKKVIPIKHITPSKKEKEAETKKLIDENDTVPIQISYLNSSYFDEIYFARSAYEYVNGTKVYEWTHPPLGKLIQAIPIKLSHKMAPFYYRLMGNLAGITMIAVMYLFGKLLFKKPKFAILAALLMTFDCFHFAHTRMGTVDSFLVLFIMLSYYYMAKFLNNPRKKQSLLWSGLFFGLSVTVKWTGFYAGLGLAIIFFIYILKKKIIKLKLLGECIIFFVIIPLCIYLLSYLCFPNLETQYTNNIPNIINQTKQMYTYHSELKAHHSFSSPWYSWPISYRPVWYYNNTVDENQHGTISGLGNIAIWWFGILAFFYLWYRLIKKKDKYTLFLLIAMLSMWLPYIFIGRVMFLYHYFPVLPFLMLGIVMLFYDLAEKTKKDLPMLIYLIIVIAIFAVYYPAISGKVMNNNYLEQLKIFSTWYF